MDQSECGWLGVNNKTKGIHRGSGDRTEWRLDRDFEMKIRLSDIFQVEARALLEGLKFVWAQGYCQVEIESGSALLIVIIQNGLVVSSKYNEVCQVYEWCFKVWDVTFH
ncbi:hypothetical protein CXB51_021426 [Gossypium anomalum]|uniref:RNase H type-1 domain-containing protein n=1 Tax=Gossypium anomalum TaxID=47600 RepID=A0A8J5YYK9_9ROSI|nr:hypothetical protein CXB51_021426 [Gossypium anomalum]